MGRRRYLSTDASKDKAIARLSRDAGFLAPLLFFMAIPHGDEAGYLPGDAAEFRLLICPGLPVSDEQVEEALTQIVNHRLWSRNGAGIRYKPESWRRIQSYITDSRFESAQNAALQRTSAQNSASSKVGWGVELELKSKAAAPLSPPAPQAAAAAASDSLNQFSPLAQKTIALYENTIGIITGMVANLISDFMDSYKGKPEWVDEAFREAAKNEARTWAYVEAILKTWAAQGGPLGRKRGREPPGGSRLDTDPEANFKGKYGMVFYPQIKDEFEADPAAFVAKHPDYTVSREWVEKHKGGEEE